MTSGNVSLETDVRGLLEAVDSKDTASLGRYFVDGIVFRFGNSDPVGGTAAVLDTYVEFLAGIAGISHQIQHLWRLGGRGHDRALHTPRWRHPELALPKYFSF
jgi:hypothetical protein